MHSFFYSVESDEPDLITRSICERNNETELFRLIQTDQWDTKKLVEFNSLTIMPHRKLTYIELAVMERVVDFVPPSEIEEKTHVNNPDIRLVDALLESYKRQYLVSPDLTGIVYHSLLYGDIYLLDLLQKKYNVDFNLKYATRFAVACKNDNASLSVLKFLQANSVLRYNEIKHDIPEDNRLIGDPGAISGMHYDFPLEVAIKENNISSALFLANLDNSRNTLFAAGRCIDVMSGQGGVTVDTEEFTTLVRFILREGFILNVSRMYFLAVLEGRLRLAIALVEELSKTNDRRYMVIFRKYIAGLEEEKIPPGVFTNTQLYLLTTPPNEIVRQLTLERDRTAQILFQEYPIFNLNLWREVYSYVDQELYDYLYILNNL